MLGEQGVQAEVVDTGGPGVPALGMIEGALQAAGLEREQIECVAIGVGPGSYTGIRAAIALAQGWQLAAAVKLLAISSAECVAAQACAEGVSGPVLVAIDAQRGEFYRAGFLLRPEGVVETERLRLVSRGAIEAEAQARGQAVLGPEARKWFPTARDVFPRAAVLAALAAGRSEFLPGEKIEPIYLRETTFVKAPPPRIVP